MATHIYKARYIWHSNIQSIDIEVNDHQTYCWVVRSVLSLLHLCTEQPITFHHLQLALLTIKHYIILLHLHAVSHYSGLHLTFVTLHFITILKFNSLFIKRTKSWHHHPQRQRAWLLAGKLGPLPLHPYPTISGAGRAGKEATRAAGRGWTGMVAEEWAEVMRR